MFSSADSVLAARILGELSRTDAPNGRDAAFIVRLMQSIVSVLAASASAAAVVATSSKSATNGGSVGGSANSVPLSRSDFAVTCLQSPRFLDLVAAHAGGDLDGWGAASALVFTSLAAMSALLTTLKEHTPPTTSGGGKSFSSSRLPQCAAAWTFLLGCQASAESPASRVLSRVIAIASSSPSSVVARITDIMSADSGPMQPLAAVAAARARGIVQHQHALQTEGAILAWHSAWECIASLVTAVGPEGRQLVLQRSVGLARFQALRRSAAVFVGYVRHCGGDDRAVAAGLPAAGGGAGAKRAAAALTPSRILLFELQAFIEAKAPAAPVNV